jgi:spore coat protein A, manganese oxidase
MKWTRREIAKLAAAGLLQTGCATHPRPQPKLLVSRCPLPAPFAIPLPVIPTLHPDRTDSTTDYYEVTARASQGQILPGFNTEFWGYNAMFPGPTIEARSGRRVSLTLHNALPRPIVNHLHGGRTPSESDGYPTDFILPAAGFTQSHMHDPSARIVTGEREYIYPNQQRASTLWYHDHRMDFTAAQVWRGLAGFYILRDAEEMRLPLPRGEKEIPLLICDRSFDANGGLFYPSLDPELLTQPGVTNEYMGGVLGDVILVNGTPWPTLEVANTKYRFRVLNACNARRLELALEPGGSFVQIGSDGGLLAAPVSHRTVRISPAERFDLIVDFSRHKVGSVVTLANQAGSGRVAKIMQFRVVRAEKDDSVIPPQLSTIAFPNASDAVATRIFDFSYQGMQGWTVNKKPYDPARMDATPKLDSTEIWRLQSDFSHPLHLHLVHFQVLSHSGRPGSYDAGWKDTISLFPGQTADILIKFSGYRGRYVFHCHNLEHEDMAMMANFEVI